MGSSRALQSAAIDLERKLAAQSLKKDLEKRSQRETLVERKIYTKLGMLSVTITPNTFQETFSLSRTRPPLSLLTRESLQSTCVKTACRTSYHIDQPPKNLSKEACSMKILPLWMICMRRESRMNMPNARAALDYRAFTRTWI